MADFLLFFSLFIPIIIGLQLIASLWALRDRENLMATIFIRIYSWTSLGSGLVLYGIFFSLFLTCDVRFAEVWSYTHPNLALITRLTSSWAGQKGSLFLWWCMVNTVTGLNGIRIGRVKENSGQAVNTVQRTHQHHRLVQFIALTGFSFTFSVLLVVMDPFELTNSIDLAIFPRGQGLVLELQSLWMIIHPPVILAGFAGGILVYCSSLGLLGAITTGSRGVDFNVNAVGLHTRYKGVTWVLLTAGIGLGAIWAYTTFGWGGFWAWDPIETSALLPWLVLTAAMHGPVPRPLPGKRNTYGIGREMSGGVFLVFGIFFCSFIARSGALFSRHSWSSRLFTAFFLWTILILGIITGLSLLILRGRAYLEAREPTGETGQEYWNQDMKVTGQTGGRTFRVLLEGFALVVVLTMLLAPHHLAPAYFEARLLPFIVAIGVSFVAIPRYRSNGQKQLVASILVALGVISWLLGTFVFRWNEEPFYLWGFVVLLTRNQVGWVAFGLILGTSLIFLAKKFGIPISGSKPTWRKIRVRMPDIVHAGCLLLLVGYFTSTFLSSSSTLEISEGQTGEFTILGLDGKVEFQDLEEIFEGNQKLTRLDLKINTRFSENQVCVVIKEDLLMGDQAWGVGLAAGWWMLGDVYLTVLDPDPDANGAWDQILFRVQFNPGVWLVWVGGLVMVIGQSLSVILPRKPCIENEYYN